MARQVKKLAKTNASLEKKEAYCRMCQKMLPTTSFYIATRKEVDCNGFMSICKTHCAEIFETSLKIERNLDRAILRTCRILDIAYAQNAVDAVKTQIQNSGKEDLQVFGIYKSKLTTLSNLANDEDLTFHANDNMTVSLQNEDITNDEKFDKYLKEFWGPDLPFEDYEFLESELARYEETHKSDTASEKSLLRQICFAELDIRKSRMGGKSGDASAIKRLQELMKTASVDPGKASLANTGKAKETFSSFVKVIEENEPASYYENKKLFQDFDGLDFYFKKYVTRPLKNFVTQSRDFNVDTEDDVDVLVDSESE